MAGLVAGTLEQLGFEEIEPGVVADTQENRRRVRMLEGEWYYEPITDETGGPTGLLKVVDPSTLIERRKSVHDRRRGILKDPDDPWSDYRGPDDYPLDGDYPYFIRQRLAEWRAAERDGIPEEERNPFPERCTVVRHDGTRCWHWASQPRRLDRCKYHRGWEADAQQNAAVYARQVILQAAPTFAHGLVELAESAESEPVRLKALTEGLDRIGVRGGTELEIKGEIEVTSPADAVRERLNVLAERLTKAQEEAEAPLELPVSASETPATVSNGETIVEAVIVSDTETQEEPDAHR